ncbi:RluA family pseudouridine synthase [soil metagenome]
MTERLEVEADADGERVDRFLAERTRLSRSAIQRLARDGRVRAGATTVDPAYRVRAGDRLVVDVPAPAPAVSLEPESIAIGVLYEDEDVLVVDKPAGLVVHPAYGHHSGTLMNAAAGRATGEEGRDAARPGIVHRLDKDTSGVMIVAKTDVAHLALARQLHARRFGKEYLALVWGDPGPQPGVIDAPLTRDTADRRRMVVRQTGREAITRFTRIAVYSAGASRAALLHVRPETGRTHQIRTHLAFARLPVVGDPVYGRTRDPSGLGRQWLHAWRLTVRLPSAGERTFTAPLAAELRAFTDTLGEPRDTTAPFDEAIA